MATAVTTQKGRDHFAIHCNSDHITANSMCHSWMSNYIFTLEMQEEEMSYGEKITNCIPCIEPSLLEGPRVLVSSCPR